MLDIRQVSEHITAECNEKRMSVKDIPKTSVSNFLFQMVIKVELSMDIFKWMCQL